MERLNGSKIIRFIRHSAILAMTIGVLMALAACSSGANQSLTIANITVVPSFPPELTAGSTQQFRAIATFSDGYTTYDVTSNVNWSSSIVSVATIDKSGLATGVAEGTCEIKASLPGVPDASAKLTVVPGVTMVNLLSIAVTPKNPGNLEVGFTKQFSAIGTYSDGSTVDITSKVTWVSSNIMVATVDNVNFTTVYVSGLAKGLASGSCNITASLSGIVSLPVNLTVVSVSTSNQQ